MKLTKSQIKTIVKEEIYKELKTGAEAEAEYGLEGEAAAVPEVDMNLVAGKIKVAYDAMNAVRAHLGEQSVETPGEEVGGIEHVGGKRVVLDPMIYMVYYALKRFYIGKQKLGVLAQMPSTTSAKGKKIEQLTDQARTHIDRALTAARL